MLLNDLCFRRTDLRAAVKQHLFIPVKTVEHIHLYIYDIYTDTLYSVLDIATKCYGVIRRLHSGVPPEVAITLKIRKVFLANHCTGYELWYKFNQT